MTVTALSVAIHYVSRAEPYGYGCVGEPVFKSNIKLAAIWYPLTSMIDIIELHHSLNLANVDGLLNKISIAAGERVIIVTCSVSIAKLPLKAELQLIKL